MEAVHYGGKMIASCDRRDTLIVGKKSDHVTEATHFGDKTTTSRDVRDALWRVLVPGLFKCYFIVGVIALRHLPTLLNVHVDENMGNTGKFNIKLVSDNVRILSFITEHHLQQLMKMWHILKLNQGSMYVVKETHLFIQSESLLIPVFVRILVVQINKNS